MLQLTDLKELVLVPALAAFFSLGRTRPKWATILGIQLSIALVVEVAGKYTSKHNLPNHGLYNGYMIVEFLLLWLMLMGLPFMNRRWRTFAFCMACLTLLAGSLECLVNRTFATFMTNTLIIGGLLIAAAAGYAIFRLMQYTYDPLVGNPVFWALLSLVTYFMCFIPVFGLYNYLASRQRELAFNLLTLNDVLFILRYLMAAGSMLLLVRLARKNHGGA